ncbi:marvel domain-containing protein [Aspergillus unguis]
MQLVTPIFRGFQAIAAIIVLGISVDLARGQEKRIEDVPRATEYAAFCGGFGIVVALVGIASLFISSLEGIATLALDGISALAMLAGGITYAVMLRKADCGDADDYDTATNKLISGGCKGITDDGRWVACHYSGDKLKSRCISARADTAFMFISFVACVAIVGWGFVMRRGRGNVSYA